MSDLHLRDRLHDEMSGLEMPPAGDLVARAVAGGVRTRRVRTATGLGSVAVVGLTVVAITAGSQLGAGPASAPASLQAGSAAVTEAVTPVTPKTVVKAQVVKPKAVVTGEAAAKPEAAGTSAGAGSKDQKLLAAQAWRARQQDASAANPPQWTATPAGVPATPQGELQLFTEAALPYGTASNFAVSEDADKTHVKAYLTTGGKTGMLDFFLYHDTLGYAGDCVQPAPNGISCHHTSDGGYVIEANDHGGCVNTADIIVVHPDGTAVQVFLASCLLDAAHNIVPGTQTLSTAEAEAIFQNPGFDFTMPADVVARGAQNIGALATFW